MLQQQFPSERLVPGVGLNDAYLQSFARIRKEKRKDLFFQPCPVVIPFRHVVDGLLQMVLIYVVRREQHHIQRHGRPRHGVMNELQHGFQRPVIPVYDTDVVSFGGKDPRVPSRDQPAVGFVYDPHTGIYARVFITDLRTSVRRPIVDQQQFKIRIGLSENAVHTVPQIFFHLIHGHDYADHSCSAFLWYVFRSEQARKWICDDAAPCAFTASNRSLSPILAVYSFWFAQGSPVTKDCARRKRSSTD